MQLYPRRTWRCRLAINYRSHVETLLGPQNAREYLPYLNGGWRCRVVGDAICIDGVNFVDSPNDLIVQKERQVVRLPIDLIE
jgi:hypothetical protein